ncbi:hypothetical protein GWK47_053486 [Chionoecetes opilio]|uniref:Uncharacterized protein n=1 Tax=Chionoecetes opilio TaxID=41210 RepID=A0A8J4XZH5_CHIOP|nr:hypothetical protein GWK47_053486 [Chionoecetes opilio]
MTTATGGHEFAGRLYANPGERLSDPSAPLSNFLRADVRIGGTRYSETVFCSRGGPVPLLHFHDTVHVRAFMSYVTPKSFSSTSLCKAVAAAVTTSDSSIPNFTSSNERTVTPRKACIPFIPITKSKPSGLVRITSALIVTDGPESSWTCTSPIPIHSQRSTLIVVMLTFTFFQREHVGAYTMHLVLPVSTRTSHFTPSTNNRTVGRALVTDSPERKLAPVLPLPSRFPGTMKQCGRAAYS